jgi:hypothetical protein
MTMPQKTKSPRKQGTKRDKGTVTPLPPKVRKALSRVEHCRSEIASIFREARAGRLDVADASKLVNILAVLARLIESSDLEKRIEQIEKSLKQEGNRP